MDIRSLTDRYAVSPQIGPEDMEAIAAAGFRTVICNRPDAEVPPSHHAAAMGEAAAAAGLAFVDNPFDHRAFSPDLVTRQGEAIETGGDKVLAYCASGNRSTILWAMDRARRGEGSAEDLVGIAARAGYDLRGLLPQLAALSGR